MVRCGAFCNASYAVVRLVFISYRRYEVISDFVRGIRRKRSKYLDF